MLKKEMLYTPYTGAVLLETPLLNKGLAFTQEELFGVIDAVMSSKDGAHALIQAYRMAGGRIEKAKHDMQTGKE